MKIVNLGFEGGISILTVLSILFQEHSMSLHFIKIFYVSLKFLFIWVLQLYKLDPICFVLYCKWVDFFSSAKKIFILITMILEDDHLPLIRNIFLLCYHLGLRN